MTKHKIRTESGLIRHIRSKLQTSPYAAIHKYIFYQVWPNVTPTALDLKKIREFAHANGWTATTGPDAVLFKKSIDTMQISNSGFEIIKRRKQC